MDLCGAFQISKIAHLNLQIEKVGRIAVGHNNLTKKAIGRNTPIRKK
jgi:hypothetical protein